MKDLISSDAHNDPNELSANSRKIIIKARREKARLTWNGDSFNLLPLGLDKFIGSPCMRQLNKALDGYPLNLIPGNHDPEDWLVKLFEGWDNVTVWHRNMMLLYPPQQNGDKFKKLDIRHGHRWAVDWRFLRHFAPELVEFMTDNFPKQWYKFCEWQGWLPSKVKEEKGEESRDYRKAIDSVWRGAAGHAYENDVTVICGHTHCENWSPAIVDAGTLKDKEYVEVDAEGVITLQKLGREAEEG